MANLTNPRVLYAKGGLFFLCGCLAGSLLLAQQPTLRNAALLAIVTWSFCRCYYFAFYVIQHYVDDQYRYSGIADFAMYCLKQNRTSPND